MLEHLMELIANSPVNPMEDDDGKTYYYGVFPTNGVPLIEASILRDIACEMIRTMNLEGVQRIVVPQAMGIHLGTALTLMTDIPLTILRKRSFGFSDECPVDKRTGYERGTLYINGLKPGMKVVVVDDVLSTGGTMKAILTALATIGVEVIDVCFVIKRGEKPDIGHEYKYLVEADVTDERKVKVTGWDNVGP
jgi:adenine phosphoribosyltransferase